jgi:hypothetical protein
MLGITIFVGVETAVPVITGVGVRVKEGVCVRLGL